MKRTQKKKSSKALKNSRVIYYVAILFIVTTVASSLYTSFFKPVLTGKNEHDTSTKLRIRISAPLNPLNFTDQLVAQGVDVSRPLAHLISLAFRLKGHPKVGLYEFSEEATFYNILLKITNGETVKAKITFIEGWPIWRLRQEVDRHPDLRHTTVNLSNLMLLQQLGVLGEEIEGIFFPSTYFFEPGIEDTQIYKLAHKAMKNKTTEIWKRRDPDIPIKNEQELIILASLIEKETGTASDRSMISGVFHNRLKKRMRLQTDPSVIYGIGENFSGNLTKKDLKRDGPYNTYTRAGLPPSPIAAPSYDSMLAAVKPAKTEALYFVANGKGGSIFSATLDEHEKAVDKYQRKRTK
jgi:UPF0755 protein